MGPAMFEHTQPAVLDDAGGIDPWAPFRVPHAADRLALFRQLRDTATPLVLAAPAGVSARCVLWSLDSDSGRLSFSADDDSPQWQGLVDANEALAVGYLDSVKLQFELDHLVLVRGAKGMALQAAMPANLYRFQRRDSFRVRPAGAIGPKLMLRHPSLPDMRLELRILDLSVGGCSLLRPADVPELCPGLTLHGVQVELDATNSFVAGLELHHIASIGNDAGAQRIGCAWHGLDPFAERALQRYVNDTQKQHRLLIGE